MLKDAQGLEVTTDSPEAIAAINQFMDQSLSYGKDIEAVILQGVKADPGCALVYAYAAAYYLTQENSQAWKQVKPLLQAAQCHLVGITKRERLYIQAIAAWAVGAIDQAIALHEEIARQYPQDLISVQQGQYHYFYLGDQERLLRIAQQVLPFNQENHYLYGMVAFGLEQCHQLEKAEAMGRKATQMNRQDPWAHHAVAHVMETQKRVEEGIVWMESLADTWENCNSMLYTHNWWHIALYYLEQGNTKKVLSLYDKHVWGKARKESPKDQVGAISLLLRLELLGIDVGNRWQDLSNYLFARIDEHALPFQDLHYIYALAKARKLDWVKQMQISMQNHALSVNPYLRQNWLEIAIPAAQGMVAHAQGDYLTAKSELKNVVPLLHRIGGSHAQRVLFEQVYRDAMWQSEKSNQTYAVFV
ncbi:tetratricopeptide repeat protein [Nostoc sp. FACHB-110]|uniref:tetratricopeptide repeat protein n=1 Tax=Nostoc sp. FACHB-110 TaxID=2692834 RepID=UPI001689C17C|nr:tetratricopeptide repeat protein [Nostoc sp. FACHB-110]MBD2438117.1 tetratricopeptide repeat protein [Nostoc sp. FACHB-110]